MYDVPVFYATTEGQTQRIAERLAAGLRQAGYGSLAVEVTSPAARSIDWADARGVVLAASLHGGAHQGTATAFAREHRGHLSAVPSLFVSVSLSAASSNPAERLAAERIAQAFGPGVGWAPTRVACVAGALAYTRYSFLKRWLMRQIAHREGGPTDTSRDHELTDWTAVDRLAAEFAAMIRSAQPHAASA